MSDVLAYPAHRESDVVLRDGATIHVRPVRGGDEEELRRFLEGLSRESVSFRFFSGGVNVERAAQWAIDVDYRDRFGLVATAGADARIVAHANYIRTAADRAEVAFAVADAFQGRGLGTLLLGQLAEVAQEQGIPVFVANVLPDNRRMLGVFRQSGFQIMRTWSEPGLIVAELPTALDPEALQRFESREQVAAAAALRTFLAPRSVAVVGASRKPASIGGALFRNLLMAGFNGPVYPVNPEAPVVQAVPAYASVRDLPGTVDLAVIAVPARHVIDVARECEDKGVRSLVVISSGFSEVGDEGRDLQRELVGICRESGMRLIGPNCMGILNTAADVALNATFSPSMPPPGRIGFMSQSGALGLAVIDNARRLGLGISSYVSVGNKADISGNDLLQYWESDDDTDVILLYLESFGNPRKFARITRRVGRTKPIVAVKGGRSQAGARATSSHTGALIAASDVTIDALFNQAGVIRTDTLAELFDVASLLGSQPLPAGPRVGIVTNAGGLGILCADACDAAGLDVVAFDDELQARLHDVLAREASTANPVDMIASASADQYRRVVEIIAESQAVDALIVIFIPPLVTQAADVARAVREAAESLEGRLPLLAVFTSVRGAPDELQAGPTTIPSFTYPEDAARALGRVVQHATWRSRPEGTVPRLEDVRSDEAAAVIASALRDGPRWLGPAEAAQLLSCYGLQPAEWRLTSTPEEAGRAAAELGDRVALKAVATGLIHKTEVRGVRLGLSGAEEVAEAARLMAAEVQAAGRGVEQFLVQRMVPPGVEMLVGVVHDPSFGPVVACGAGGTAVELMRDVAVRITPLTDVDASEMVRSLQTFPLLDGYRGAPKADVDALEDVVLRVGVMVDNHSEVAELDLNPVIVLERGAMIVDARIRVEQARPRTPLGARLPLP